MSSTLTALGTLPPEHVPTFWETLINRICPPVPLTPEEQQTEKMRQDTERLRQEALKADANLFTAAAIKASEEAALLNVQRKEISDRLAREENEREKKQKNDDLLRIQFTARQTFKRGQENNYQIIVTLGESISGQRGIISWRGIDPNGGVIEVTKDTQEFFRTRMIYTNLVLPWIHDQVSTEDLKTSEYNRQEGTRIEFPLAFPKKKK